MARHAVRALAANNSTLFATSPEMRCVLQYAILLRYVSPGVHESPYRDDILSMAIATSAAAFVHPYKLTVCCDIL